MLAVYSSCIICLLCLNFSRANVREMRLESQQGPGGWRRHNGDFRTSCPMDQHVLRTLKKIIIIKRLGYNKNKDFWRKITRLFSDKCINVLISALACKDKQAASPAIRPSDIRNKRHWTTTDGYPPVSNSWDLHPSSAEYPDCGFCSQAKSVYSMILQNYY